MNLFRGKKVDWCGHQPRTKNGTEINVNYTLFKSTFSDNTKVTLRHYSSNFDSNGIWRDDHLAILEVDLTAIHIF
jgi:hypothetical protein